MSRVLFKMRNANAVGFLLVLILVLAAILRIGWLSRGDVLTDESAYAFRSIALIDYYGDKLQTTPYEWFDPDIPFWTRLSFHDHPPLLFLIQYVFMRVLGDTHFAFRLPSALLGIASVYLIYKIGLKLYSRNVGLLAAALLAVTANHVYISRVGFHGVYIVFFLLLVSYLFLRSFDNDKYFIWTGVAVGMALLTHYALFIVVPAMGIYLVFFRRDTLKNRKLRLGALVVLLLFSPVIVYNYQLYQSVQHFDLQLSYVFGQNPEVWQAAPGKDIGSLTDRLYFFPSNLIASNSWVLLSLFTLSFALFIVRLGKTARMGMRRHGFLILSSLYLIVLVLLVGPSFRFLVVFTPILVLSVAVLFISAYQKRFRDQRARYATLIIIAAVILFELLYTINSQIAFYPRGPEMWAYSRVRSENFNWGYNELERYLKNELGWKTPDPQIEQKYVFLQNLQDDILLEAEQKHYRSYSAVVVYDSNLHYAPQIWNLLRLKIYHAWPVVTTQTFLKFLEENKINGVRTSTFSNHYFIVPTGKIKLRNPANITTFGVLFERDLQERGIQYESLYNPRGDEVFRVYKF